MYAKIRISLARESKTYIQICPYDTSDPNLREIDVLVSAIINVNNIPLPFFQR